MGSLILNVLLYLYMAFNLVIVTVCLCTAGALLFQMLAGMSSAAVYDFSRISMLIITFMLNEDNNIL